MLENCIVQLHTQRHFPKQNKTLSVWNKFLSLCWVPFIAILRHWLPLDCIGHVTSFCFWLCLPSLIFIYLSGRVWGSYFGIQMSHCFKNICWKDYPLWLSIDSVPLWKINICVVLFLDCFFLINVSIFLSIEVVTFQASDYWWGSLVLAKLSLLSKVIQQQTIEQDFMLGEGCPVPKAVLVWEVA